MSNEPSTSEQTFQPHAIAMTIAGSDPSGGAGMQADLKTFQQLGVYGASAITLLTVQNTQTVDRIEMLTPTLVIDQINAIVSDFDVANAKTGALGNASIIDAVAQRAASFKFPIDRRPCHGQQARQAIGRRRCNRSIQKIASVRLLGHAESV